MPQVEEDRRTTAASPPVPQHYAALIYPLGVFLLLTGAWEGFSRARFRHPSQSVSPANQTQAAGRTVIADPAWEDDISATMKRVPPPAALRLLCLGSSQMVTVKDGEFSQSIPFALQLALSEAKRPAEVVDLSGKSQQVCESVLVMLGSQETVRPDAVVIGVGLFSMQWSTIREAFAAAFPVGEVAHRMRENLPPDASLKDVEALLAFSTSAKERLSPKGKTIQQEMDERIAGILTDHLALVAERQVMFNVLLDTPIRRDLVAYAKRKTTGIAVARTFGIGGEYGPSLLALDVLGRFCRRQNLPLLVVMLPYEHGIKPIPYTEESRRRLLDDLTARAAQGGFHLLDLSDLLGNECFGLYVDGSPDGLHFTAAGHAAVGRSIARELSAILKDGNVSRRAQ